MSTAVIILAAGHGSRMNSDLPKVLHKLAGAPMLWHAMQRADQIEADKTIVVVGHGGEEVKKSALLYNPEATVVWQTEQNGTGHAVQQASEELVDFEGDAIVLYGDTPFVSPEVLGEMLEKRRAGNDVVVLGFTSETPGGYGRLVVENNALMAIVEAKDCTPIQLDNAFCNSGVVAADAKVLFELLNDVKNENASGEIYLTDIVAIANGKNLTCTAINCPESETVGVNSRKDLARAEIMFQQGARAQAMENGVTLTAPETVFFAFDTVVGRDVTIEPNVFFGPNVSIENGAEIKAFSHFEGCHISTGCQIGPFARLRPGAELAANAKVGNFVEIKAAQIETGAKVSHLTYVGDARVGAGTNIGAGTIFCNYDGVSKHHTDIGENVFIGSNTALIAPVSIGDDGFVATGTVVSSNVPATDMAIGRARQINKTGLGKKLMDRLRAAKAARK